MRKYGAAAVRSEVRSKGQITIPASIRKQARIEEGDLIELSVTPDGVLMRPLKTIDAGQAWFWTEEWQEGERQASDDIRSKRTTRYVSGKALLASLKK